MKSRKEFAAEQERLRHLYPKIRARLEQIPGVLKVGIGLRKKAGSTTDEAVIRVFVKEKRTRSDIPASELIPEEIEGVKTDVDILYDEEQLEDTSRYRPLEGGCQVQAQGGGRGTLGCIARLKSDNTVVILSCEHVLYYGSATTGTEIGQPEYVDSICCTCGEMATNVHGINRDHIDCAIARLHDNIGWAARVLEIGPIAGIADAVMNDIVKKRGRTTELTNGKVTDLDLDASGTKIEKIKAERDGGNKKFADYGDSGSVLLNDDDKVVGLIAWAHLSSAPYYGRATGIQEVLDALKADGKEIEIITGGGTGNIGLGTSRLASMPAVSDPLTIVQRRLRRSPNGSEIWSSYEAHQREILELVNHRRPVTVAWQRSQGPTLLAAVRRSMRVPGYYIPRELNGIPREESVETILQSLQTHGSESLREVLEKHAPTLIDVCTQNDTVEDMIRAIERESRLITQ